MIDSKSKSKITLIAAVDEKNGIGRDGDIPWNVPEDLAFFRTQTMGHAVLMGRKTFDSLGARPLTGRFNYVLSRSPRQARDTEAESLSGAPKNGETPSTTIVWGDDFDTLLARACREHDIVYICGGAAIYARALPRADDIWISKITGDYGCDVLFPEIPSCFQRQRGEARTGFYLEHYVRCR